MVVLWCLMLGRFLGTDSVSIRACFNAELTKGSIAYFTEEDAFFVGSALLQCGVVIVIGFVGNIIVELLIITCAW